ncbi:MAG TPA: rhodanese-like domain-containing protein [Candidatus Tumulicola sp.]|nr:rhodanese-like domain-containing protein [Candidatus Tumulicola sp.]
MSDSEIRPLAPDELDATTAILDVRRHAGGHQIRGATRYDARLLLDAPKLALPLSHEAPIAVYGDSDETVARVVERLRRDGYTGAAPLAGGFLGWRDSGRPVEALTQEQPIPGEPGAGMQRL